MLDIILYLKEVSAKVDEFDDRIEFTFCSSKLQDYYRSYSDKSHFNDIVLRWESERQNDWNFLLNDLTYGQELELKAIVKKNKLINSFSPKANNPEIEEYFFLKKEFFIDIFLEKVKNEPLLSSTPLYKNEKTIVWLCFSDLNVSSDKLIIKDITAGFDCDFNHSDLVSLPTNEQIKSQVHFVGQDQYTCDLSRYRLPTGTVINEFTSPFYEGYEKLLATCLVKEFVSDGKVIISGVKKLSLELSSDMAELDIANILILEEAVVWAYEERTEVRLLLLIDRISLDIPDDSFLIPSIYNHLKKAVEQAKDKYEFVIKDRKEAHAKELADLYKDIKSTTDAYSKSAGDLISSLLRDALSAIFVLAIMLFSRLIGKEDLLNGPCIHWLFVFLSVYLIFAPIVRISFEWFSLELNKKDLLAWKDTTRNHLSHRELEEIIDCRIKEHKVFYIKGAVVALALSALLAIFALFIPQILSTTSSGDNNITHSELVDYFEINRKLLVGPQGDTGPQGVKGDVGPQGSQGPRGYRGVQGLKGETGPQGVPGPKGDNGNEGEVGSFITVTVS